MALRKLDTLFGRQHQIACAPRHLLEAIRDAAAWVVRQRL
jgi:hypothetical protein